MLRTGNYPLYLKTRILSDTGHLSNDDCANEVKRLINSGTTHIILGHLSQDNNHPRPCILSRPKNNLKFFTVGKDYLLGVAPVESGRRCCNILNINLIVIGKLKEDYLRNACAEYIKRLSRYCSFELHELDEYRLSDNPSERKYLSPSQRKQFRLKNMQRDS